MRNNTLLALSGILMIAAALVVRHALEPLGAAKSCQLPVGSFPLHVGKWTSGPNRPVSNDVRMTLPHAAIIERVYTRPDGQSLDLLFVSSDVADEMHTPQVCLPAQGWEIERLQQFRLGEDRATDMVVSHEGHNIELMYWFTAKTTREISILQRIQMLRAHLVGVSGEFVVSDVEGYSLLVRIIGTNTPDNHKALLEFVHQVQAPIRVLSEKRNTE